MIHTLHFKSFSEAVDLLVKHGYTEDYPPGQDYKGCYWEFMSRSKGINAKVYDRCITFERVRSGNRCKDLKCKCKS